jgi:hypothetical protein
MLLLEPIGWLLLILGSLILKHHLHLMLLLLHHLKLVLLLEHDSLLLLIECNLVLLVDKLGQLLSGHRKYLIQATKHEAFKVFIRDAENGWSVRLDAGISTVEDIFWLVLGSPSETVCKRRTVSLHLVMLPEH